MIRLAKTLIWLFVACTIVGFWVCNRMASDAPDGQPFGGAVDLLVKEDRGGAANEGLWLDVSPTGEDLYSDEPFLQYKTIVCADRPITFALVLTGAARVENTHLISAIVGVPEVLISSSNRTWVYNEQSIEAQVIEVSVPSPSPCTEMSHDTRLKVELGTPIVINGAVSGPVIRTAGPAWFIAPRKWYALPSIGHMPGVSDYLLGRFDRPFGLNGEWSRSNTSVRVARFGVLTTRAEIEVVRPAPISADALEWRSYDAISPVARVTDANDIRRWESWGLVFAILLGVSTSLLAALAFQWLGDRRSTNLVRDQHTALRAQTGTHTENLHTSAHAERDIWWALGIGVLAIVSLVRGCHQKRR